MILLDTNVVSELSRDKPDPRVMRFIDSLERGEAWISSITIAEIKLGLALMPDGRRKAHYTDLAQRTIDQLSGTCAAFDALAAEEFAMIMSKRRSIGRPMEYPDAQIASIALAVGLALATRNTTDFEEIEGLKVVNPWD